MAVKNLDLTVDSLSIHRLTVSEISVLLNFTKQPSLELVIIIRSHAFFFHASLLFFS